MSIEPSCKIDNQSIDETGTLRSLNCNEGLALHVWTKTLVPIRLLVSVNCLLWEVTQEDLAFTLVAPHTCMA